MILDVNYVSYVWIFFAIVAGFYSILLFFDYDKVIPESFRKNRKHPFYSIWKMFAASSFLILTASFILFTITEYVDDTNTYIVLRIAALLMLILGLVVLYFSNKKAINLFNPGYFDEEEEKKKKRKKKK